MKWTRDVQRRSRGSGDKGIGSVMFVGETEQERRRKLDQPSSLLNPTSYLHLPCEKRSHGPIVLIDTHQTDMVVHADDPLVSPLDEQFRGLYLFYGENDAVLAPETDGHAVDS